MKGVFDLKQNIYKEIFSNFRMISWHKCFEFFFQINTFLSSSSNMNYLHKIRKVFFHNLFSISHLNFPSYLNFCVWISDTK